MAASLTGRSDLDTAIAATGFKASFNQNYDLNQAKEKLQHRHSDALNKAAVRNYTQMFKAGSVPPAIGMSRDGFTLWGNHRRAAALAAKRQFIPAVIIDVDAAGADESTRDRLLTLAITENAPNGVPYNALDRQDRALTLIKVGYTHPSICALLGLSSSQVSGIKARYDAEQRLETLGLPSFDTKETLHAFAKPDARALNDVVFKELVVLSKDAGFRGQEIADLAKDAKAAGSDVDALALLSKVRKDNEQRIAEVKLGGQPRPTPLGQLQGALKKVLALCDNKTSATAYIDRGATAAATMAELDDAIKCLQGIRAVQITPDEEAA